VEEGEDLEEGVWEQEQQVVGTRVVAQEDVVVSVVQGKGAGRG
jgi:hypothetical protein